MMALSDWQAVPGGITPPGILGVDGTNAVIVAATFGEPRPPGAGGSALGFRALRADTSGTVALATAQPDFSPVAPGKDQSISLAMKKYAGGSPFVFLALEDPPITGGRAYILGIDQTGRLALTRGTLDDALGGSTIARASIPIADGAWVHLKFDAVMVGVPGDVVLRVWTNDLAAHGVDGPAWVPHPELDLFVDDIIGANAAQRGVQGVPRTDGHLGLGARLHGAGARAYFSHVQSIRKT